MSESIREWYGRKVGGSVRKLWWTGITATAFVIFFWFAAPDWVHLRLQIFNGAATIPVYGGLWLAAFILIWLIPMREVSFRSQESMERMETGFDRIEKRVMETLDRVDRITKRLEEKLEAGAIEKLEDHIEAIRKRIDKETQPLPVNRRPKDEETQVLVRQE